MGKEKIENLGFNEVNNWDTEEQKKKDLFKRLVEIDKMSHRNILRMRGNDEHDNNLYNVWLLNNYKLNWTFQNILMADSLTLYVHLIPSSANKAHETVKVDLAKEAVLNDLLYKVYIHLNQ